ESNRLSSVAPSCVASATTNVTAIARSAALARAIEMARSDQSAPTTVRPREARNSAFSPVPQPASSTDPRNPPASKSRSTTGCGRPISHGGGSPTYAESQLRAIAGSGHGRGRPNQRSDGGHDLLGVARQQRERKDAHQPARSPTLDGHDDGIRLG